MRGQAMPNGVKTLHAMVRTMFYELTQLGGPLLKMAGMDAAAQEWMEQADAGTVLGRWRTDIGPLGQVLLLRSFESSDALAEERPAPS